MKVKATYIGQRQLTESKLAGAFLVKGKGIVYFGHIRRAEIGREYWITKIKDGHRAEKYPEAVAPELDVDGDDAQVRKWTAEETKCEKEVRRIKAYRKASKNARLQEMIGRLKKFCEGMTYTQRRGVVEYLMDESGKK